MNLFNDKNFTGFVIKFLLLFALFYYGTLAVIGLAAPGGYYSPFIEHYLDYVSWIKTSLMHGVSFFLSLFGIETTHETGFIVRMEHKRGVIIAYDCVGYGVYSFWAAFVLATKAALKRKVYWLTGGLLLLWLINTGRIALFLVSINRGWPMPFHLDHHTLFNITAYAAILLMMWLFDRNTRS
ncbi:MAG: hypothetical protein WAT19_10025 [Ferruginibacter sp.]